MSWNIIKLLAKHKQETINAYYLTLIHGAILLLVLPLVILYAGTADIGGTRIMPIYFILTFMFLLVVLQKFKHERTIDRINQFVRKYQGGKNAKR